MISRMLYIEFAYVCSLGGCGCVCWCVKPLLDRLLSMSMLEGLACLLMYMHGLWLLLFLWYTLCHMLHMELRTPSFCSLFLTPVKICLNVFLDFKTAPAYDVINSQSVEVASFSCVSGWGVSSLTLLFQMYVFSLSSMVVWRKMYITERC